MASEAEIEEGLFKQEIFADIMSKFDSQTLTYKGKGGINIPVTNKKQAYARVMAICNKAWTRHSKNHQAPPSKDT